MPKLIAANVCCQIKIWFLCVADRYPDPKTLFDAVVKCGPDRWYEIGLELGYSDGKLNDLVLDMYGGGQKLRRIINTKACEVGAETAADELLKACCSICDPIIGAVSDALL